MHFLRENHQGGIHLLAGHRLAQFLVRLRHRRRLLLQTLQASRRLARVSRPAEFRQGLPQILRMLAERLLISLLVSGIRQHCRQHGAPLQTGEFRRAGAHLTGEVLLPRRHVGRTLEVSAEFAGYQ